MSPPQAPQPQPQIVIFWILWFSILSGLLIIQFFAAGGLPSGTDHGDPPVLFQGITFMAASVALIIRFGVIPRIRELPKKLPAMIIGLAVSEGIGIIGAFVVRPQYGSTKLFMLAVSIVCIVFFAPFYAKASSGGNPFTDGSK